MKDKKVLFFILKERKRQREGIELIPSENYASKEVKKVLSSEFVNKYSEGYPGKRYYGGNEWVDEIEKLAQERAKRLFNVEYVNVQPYSGSPANLAVHMALCKPGEVIMGQTLTSGGHLTHGHHVSASGIFFKAYQYGLKKKGVYQDKDLFDYNEIEKLVSKVKPKAIWVGTSAYPLIINYKKFYEIAEKVNAYLVADIAHIAGLIVAGVHPSPVPYVHVITTTTHKTLRGPRGAMIMITKKGLKKDPDLPKKIDSAVFPGLQGGPHDNQTAAIAVALYEASQPSFKRYVLQIVKNAKKLAEVLREGGLQLVGGGTDNHLILVNLTNILGPGAGIFVQKALDKIGLTVNKNTVPDETSSPFYPSGIRLGTPAATSRGMKEKEMEFIGKKILEVIDLLKKYRLPKENQERVKYIANFEREISQNKILKRMRLEVKKVALKFAIP